LRRFLQEVQPELVLVEGLADAADLTRYWVQKGTRPPIAILAYTADLPVRTLVYPIARYSPEFQAVVWAHENKVPLEFIDLPSDVFLGLQELDYQRLEKAKANRDIPREQQSESESESSSAGAESPEVRKSLYDQLAQHCGEVDYDTYWERHFEHNLSDHAYRLAAHELGRSLREFEQGPALRRAENLVREAYMRRCVKQAVDRGIAPQKIVAVVGAFHAPVLNGDCPAMSDDELATLPRRESLLTLMPYSYFRLSSQSGYGAGNAAPAYFELLWDALVHHDLNGLAGRYLSLVARHVRETGSHRSTASVIEGVRLARSLSTLHDGHVPTLRDLHDAAVTLIGHGELATVSEAIAHVDVGTAIGELPPGVSQTSIQQDFDRQLSRLKLEPYRTTVKRDLTLDLRENRAVKSESAAWLDLHRSSFLHQLRILSIPFATHLPTTQQSATWAEHWALQWSPESEISLVEAVLLGETVRLACGYKLKIAIEEATTIDEAARLVHDAMQCGLPAMMEHARKRLQELSASRTAMIPVARAAYELAQVVRFGDVRKLDTAPLVPLIEELFVQGCLALHAAAACDHNAAKELAVAIDQMNRVSLECSDDVDESLWKRVLQALADADDRNSFLSGLACAILLERGIVSNDALAREVSRRLSPGISADLGAGWFEGLAARNRYALIARQVLWEQLADYVASLDEEQFRRSLVFLRRAFGTFSANEKRNIAENLANAWGADADQISETLNDQLTAAEEEALDALNEFDFDDL
jgi:hypothetical protein